MASSGFTETSLEKRLSELNPSQQSIQQLSLWLMHHKRHYQNVVKLWYKEITKTSKDKKLNLLYLANDFCQNSKKKHPEISREFGMVMKKAMEHLKEVKLEGKVIKSIGRLLGIWKDRSLFEPKIQAELDKIWSPYVNEHAGSDTSTAPSPAKKYKKDSPHKKKIKVTVEKTENHQKLPDDPAALIAEATYGSKSSDLLHDLLNQSPSNEDEDKGASVQPPTDPPDPEELIKALQDLENAPSADGEVRDAISKFPVEVSEVRHLDKLQSSDEARVLQGKVKDALEILKDYNDRLQQELKDRKKVRQMITDFLSAQKDLESQAEERLEQYRDKLEKINSVRDDLKCHIQSLPDLTKLPDVTTGGLAPLPSAGDLFTHK